ncbi:hypothetical protein [Nodosilinea nodulosa]|uniref:hypothetical protein n=1 Tax=Nodosilinea nodulosa TaxID=416001 RepID=UPI0002E766B2|nr:hypothetical protein [Nodosilinea nodulosa]
MEFIKAAGMAILGGWIIGIVFAGLKLPAPVPPLLGLVGAAAVVFGGYCYELAVKLILKQ